MIISSNLVQFPIPFSYPDPKDLRQELFNRINQVIKPSKKFQERFKNANLKFIIVHDRKPKSLEIKGPTYDKELVDYALWIPHKQIQNSENYLVEYFNVLEKGILKVLKEQEFDLIEIQKVFSEFNNLLLEKYK